MQDNAEPLTTEQIEKATAEIEKATAAVDNLGQAAEGAATAMKPKGWPDRATRRAHRPRKKRARPNRKPKTNEPADTR